jgi:2,4-dienoyl-CoA reductase-like NADH-dependent reductase (Old Yellow Enzyme family)
MDTVFVSPELQPVANCGLHLKNRVVRAPMTRDWTGTREQVLNHESANHVCESRIKESAAWSGVASSC